MQTDPPAFNHSAGGLASALARSLSHLCTLNSLGVLMVQAFPALQPEAGILRAAVMSFSCRHPSLQPSPATLC